MPPCPQCAHENADHARFCARCGVMLAAPGDPLIGRVVGGRYRVTQLIGEGGMGRVYRAEQRLGTASRAVALKVLATSMADAVAVSRFHRECETVVQLTHPSTIRFYDFGQLDVPLASGGVDNRLFIAMEHVDGRSLAQAIAAGPMPLDAVLRLVRQIAGALTEAHRRGIVHRDLKPDNVLLARDEVEGEIAKVCDFGIAKQGPSEIGPGRSQLTARGTIVGTPAYMSPEQLSGEPVDERSDVYALALMTYEMLTGARPFVAGTPLEWATAHLQAEPRPFDDFPATRALPDEVRQAVLRGLVKDPGQRTESARRFAAELSGRDDPYDLVPSPAPGTIRSSGAETSTPGGIARTRAQARATGGLWPSLALLGGTALALGIGTVLVLGREGAIHPSTPSPDLRPHDAGVDAQAPRTTEEWLSILQDEERTRDAPLALGAPDGRCARIGPRGTITLELTPGVRIATDGSAAADLHVVVDERESGPYRVEVGIERRQWVAIAQGLVASSGLDVDQYEITRFRYVRITNRERQGVVCVDAVAAFHRPGTPSALP